MVPGEASFAELRIRHCDLQAGGWNLHPGSHVSKKMAGTPQKTGGFGSMFLLFYFWWVYFQVPCHFSFWGDDISINSGCLLDTYPPSRATVPYPPYDRRQFRVHPFSVWWGCVSFLGGYSQNPSKPLSLGLNIHYVNATSLKLKESWYPPPKFNSSPPEK